MFFEAFFTNFVITFFVKTTNKICSTHITLKALLANSLLVKCFIFHIRLHNFYYSFGIVPYYNHPVIFLFLRNFLLMIKAIYLPFVCYNVLEIFWCIDVSFDLRATVCFESSWKNLFYISDVNMLFYLSVPIIIISFEYCE